MGEWYSDFPETFLGNPVIVKSSKSEPFGYSSRGCPLFPSPMEIFENAKLNSQWNGIRALSLMFCPVFCGDLLAELCIDCILKHYPNFS